jgi:hypothetical protein
MSMSGDAGQNAEAEWQDGGEWDVSIGPDLPGRQASIVLRLSKDGRTIRHRLDARTATKLSNALIVEAEKAQFQATRRKPNEAPA